MADIKPSIKPDPDAQGASPAAFEDDIYEDAGDLEFNTDPNFQKVYLARIPRELWEAWSHLDEDAEIQLGTVRMEVKQQPNGESKVPSFLLPLEVKISNLATARAFNASELRCCTAPTGS